MVRGQSNREILLSGLEKMLLVASASGVFYISLDTDDFTPMELSDIHDPDRAVDVDYDPVDRFIYWIDGERQRIRRCHFDGSSLEVQ